MCIADFGRPAGILPFLLELKSIFSVTLIVACLLSVAFLRFKLYPSLRVISKPMCLLYYDYPARNGRKK